eukprot:2864953-Rhodomonas_salina.1
MWVKAGSFQCAKCPARAFTTPMRPAVAPGSALGEWLESKEGSDTEGDSELEAEDREVSEGDGPSGVFDEEESEEEPEEAAFPPSSMWTVDDWRLLYSSSKEAVKRGGQVGRARREV